MLSACSRNFAALRVSGSEANRERAGALVEQSLAMATSLATEIGYDAAAAIAKEASAAGRTVREVAIERSGLSAERISELFNRGDPLR